MSCRRSGAGLISITKLISRRQSHRSTFRESGRSRKRMTRRRLLCRTTQTQKEKENKNSILLLCIMESILKPLVTDHLFEFTYVSLKNTANKAAHDNSRKLVQETTSWAILSKLILLILNLAEYIRSASSDQANLL